MDIDFEVRFVFFGFISGVRTTHPRPYIVFTLHAVQNCFKNKRCIEVMTDVMVKNTFSIYRTLREIFFMFVFERTERCNEENFEDANILRTHFNVFCFKKDMCVHKFWKLYCISTKEV